MTMMNVLKAVPMVNLTVAPMVAHMVSASMAPGHVTEWLTALMAQMKENSFVIMPVPMMNLHVAMDLVSMAHGHVTVMVTVLMAQMKPTVVHLPVIPVNLIGQIMEPNAVIQLGIPLV